MKKVLVLLFLFLYIRPFVDAQAYQKFLVDSAHWRIQENICLGNCDGTPDPNTANYIDDIHLKFDGDTVIGNLKYKKLIQNMQRNLTNGPGGGPLQVGYYPCNILALLSEDTIQRKVFIKYINPPYAYAACTDDSVLFDFTKQVGDSMSIGCPNTISLVDSVYYTNLYYLSRLVKVWHLLPTSHSTDFILWESVGSNLGLWVNEPSSMNYYSSTLVDYCIGTDSACGFSCTAPLGVDDPMPNKTFAILYPNPSADKITLCLINDPSRDNLVIILSDMLGQQIYSCPVIAGNTEINISSFTNGFTYGI